MTSFVCMLHFVIEAVPPPLLHPLVENKKLKFGGEASVRITGASVPSHVSVSVLDVRSVHFSKGTLKTHFGLKAVLLFLSSLCVVMVVMV